MEIYRKTVAEINLDHLNFNLENIRKNFPGHFLCPMVKANAYGHGDVAIAKCLEKNGVKSLGVCLIEEGLSLRSAGIKTQILVFRGFDRKGAQALIEHKMTPVVSDWKQIEHLESVAKEPTPIHVKFDTGMNRLGFQISEAQKLFDYFWGHKKIRIEALLTHLSQGEDGFKEDGATVEQLLKLKPVIEIFKALNVQVHVLNSSGILSSLKLKAEKKSKHLLTTYSWGLRPGLMLYGYNPIQSQFEFPLKPVMTLKSSTSVFRQVKKGEGVSYNSTWRASKDSVIGVIPMGYGDGFHRLLSNKAEALFLNERVPLVGTVCMDFMMVDVTEVAQKKSFDQDKEHEIIFFGANTEGKSISAAELAQKAETVPWEILTSIGARVPRRYIGEFLGAG